MNTVKVLNVKYRDRLVGTLAMTKDRRVAFSYAEEWIEKGFSISPFTLPLKEGVYIAEKSYFNGLFGVFGDSLPDAWGKLLVDRLLNKNNIPLQEISVLDRLAIVGNSGMGALTYEPETVLTEIKTSFDDLDRLAADCNSLLISNECENLDELYRLGGSSGGARPKVTILSEGIQWLVKFPAHVDGDNIGLMEYEYNLCAQKCGIQVPEFRLFSSSRTPGYFGSRRFDHSEQGRLHMLTAAAMLEVDYQSPSLDYHSLMKLTQLVTRNDKTQLWEMYRRMCFNIWAHNCDDHAKNFTYLYNENEDRFILSPAYDLTNSTTYYGEHTTSVDGNGKNPGIKELTAVGTAAGLSMKECRRIAEDIRDITHDMLKKWII